VSQVIVRRATPADGPALADVARRSYAQYVERIGRPPAPMTADYEAVAALGNTFLMERDEQVIALLVLKPAADYLLLENVAVVPEEQGSGVGQRLLVLAEQEAQRLGLPEVRLYTNAAMTENLSYYARHGYQETHRAFDDGFDRVYFTRVVSTNRGPSHDSR
jgi:N-acetylglutamate synthase-like GNAT family acetyltransferase